MGFHIHFHLILSLSSSIVIEKGALDFPIPVLTVYFEFLKPSWIRQHLRRQFPEMERFISRTKILNVTLS